MFCFFQVQSPSWQPHVLGKMKVVNLMGDAIIITAILLVAATAVLKLWRDGVREDVVAFAPPSRRETLCFLVA